VRIVALAVSSVLIACSASRVPNRHRSTVATPVGLPSLRSGEYRLTLVAASGSHKRAVADGALNLVPASATDRSPATGRLAQDFNDTPQFYGWTDLDFARVGAPICTDDTSPAPGSRDPLRPGVLVTAKTARAYPPAILIGTLSNLREGALYTDGCGIALFLEASDGHCYTGSWGAWGIAIDGAGTFRACAVTEAETR
jgi:hypothetical protein